MHFFTGNLLEAFLAGLHSSFPRTEFWFPAFLSYLTMEHSTGSILCGYTLGNILKALTASIASAKTE